MERYLGANRERLELFHHLLEKGIEYMKSLGSRVPCEKFERDFQQRALVVRRRREVGLQEPEDHWTQYSDYCAAHGDPSNNGLGHKRTTLEGKDVVIIPGSKVGNIIRSHKVQHNFESTVCDI